MIESDWERHLSLQKAIEWEKAKGALRTMVAIQGQTYGRRPDNETKFDKTRKMVEKFIKQFEDEGLDRDWETIVRRAPLAFSH